MGAADVAIVFDCDQAGRDAAARIAADLKAAGVRGSVIDLANRRHDGYDLTDWRSSRPELHGAELRWALGAPGTRSCSRRTGPRAMRLSSWCAVVPRRGRRGGLLVVPVGLRCCGRGSRGRFRARPRRRWRRRGVRVRSARRERLPARIRCRPPRLRFAARVTCRSTSMLSARRARSSPLRSASAIAPSAAPATITPRAASATRRCAASWADRSCPACAWSWS
jgi:hypothetical protein